VKLLTDGTEKNPILGFCLIVISQHGENWPPTEEALAREFVNWIGYHSFLTRNGLKELCQAKGVNLSFVPLPQDIRGFNCSFQDKKEIVITEPETAPFADSHTLFHEFREILEHVLAELGHPTIGPEDFLEVQAEHFAILCRMEGAERELPAVFDMVQNVEKKWARYLASAVVILFSVAYMFSCVYTPQMEEMLSDARRQRAIRVRP
jgi:hypothetical protein